MKTVNDTVLPAYWGDLTINNGTLNGMSILNNGNQTQNTQFILNGGGQLKQVLFHVNQNQTVYINNIDTDSTYRGSSAMTIAKVVSCLALTVLSACLCVCVFGFCVSV